jgi:formamidopyrimidine-DNA glycosylase
VGRRALAQRLPGQQVERVWRRAKLVVVDLSRGDRLVVQPRFTGSLLVDDGTLPEGATDYTAVEFALDDGRTLRYRDVRRLGTVSLMSSAAFADYAARLGAEPLDPAFSARHLSGLLRGSRRAVKKVLMDQRRVAGIGNIYANEALWRAGIDPSRTAHSVGEGESSRLHEALTAVLREAIEARGTTFRDFRDARGERGTFAGRLAVYGRGGEPCLRCRGTLVETHAVDGRSTVFCTRCQC